MMTCIKNLLLSFSLPEEPPLSEEEHLLAEIEETRKKIGYAWNHLDHADPEYVDIAVLELLLAETQYGILNKRYRLMLGLKNESPYLMPSTAKVLSSNLAKNCSSHAFYGSLINHTIESNPPSGSPIPQLMSQDSSPL
ncbi:hypothetical protein Desor_5298 [Desulfosporosinus orientis DSM 765]|uniref:Uncharacterized protein n=1 Tax=Desulfosporosinus orientis (strain ATCC 19365 / DSM 765 / NCIMB 8382 / VKM B-1628 / Singapore I) TaxID=768706 RepID=G7WC60_DESOD|nr:hypothetical protein [Desulfosporosinus orientis]AET70678.1 hypothetical protein Desor_5298 [Desulfosporosinus orientis DSM 765]